MSKWIIDKTFDFCYGHRVWSQELKSDYCATGDTHCACRHPHGHQGHVHIFLESDKLERGMVTDFKHLGWVKNFLDSNLDHKFIIDENDPIFSHIIGGHLTLSERVLRRGDNGYPVDGCHPDDDIHIKAVRTLEIDNNVASLDWSDDIVRLELIPSYVPGTDHLAGYNLDVSGLEGPIQEFYEGYFIVDFLPTSENLSKWVYDCVDAKMSLIDVKTSQVDWFETPKSRSSYRG